MPYNTRRVSLSLPSLGIQLPGSSNSSRRSLLGQQTSTSSSSSSPSSSSGVHATNSAKRIKRSHTTSFDDAIPPPAPRRRKSSAASTPLGRNAPGLPSLPSPALPLPASEHTPPPSPIEPSAKIIDKEGINDDIVVAVLEQLEATGNRPHQIKELAALLINRLTSVGSSQNPTAIISTRLANYLRRPWTALAPCPLAKEQVAQHPRRVYYFLTTQPRLPIPEYVEPQIQLSMSAPRVLSPNPSSGTEDEVDEVRLPVKDNQNYFSFASGGHHALNAWTSGPPRGREPSPSPSVDFGTSYTEGDLYDQHGGGLHVHNPSISGSLAELSFDPSVAPKGFSFINRGFPIHQEVNLSRSQSPPMENDEREFTITANVMQLRKESEQADRSARESAANSPRDTPFELNTETDLEVEVMAASAVTPDRLTLSPSETKTQTVSQASQEAQDAETLFGHQSHRLAPLSSLADLNNSPMLRPTSSKNSMMIPLATTSGNHASNRLSLEIADRKMAGVDEVVLPMPNVESNNGKFEYEDEDFDVRSPECVELSELDDLFGGF